MFTLILLLVVVTLLAAIIPFLLDIILELVQALIVVTLPIVIVVVMLFFLLFAQPAHAAEISEAQIYNQVEIHQLADGAIERVDLATGETKFFETENQYEQFINKQIAQIEAQISGNLVNPTTAFWNKTQQAAGQIASLWANALGKQWCELQAVNERFKKEVAPIVTKRTREIVTQYLAGI